MSKEQQALLDVLYSNSNTRYSIEASVIVKDRFEVVVYDHKGVYDFGRGFKTYTIKPDGEVFIDSDWAHFCTLLRIPQSEGLALYDLCKRILAGTSARKYYHQA